MAKKSAPILLILLIVMLLSACGGKTDDSPSLQGVRPESTSAEGVALAADESSAFSAASAPARNQLVLPAVEDVPGALVFVANEMLYLARFDGQDATPLGVAYSPVSVKTAPDGTGAAYISTQDGRTPEISYADFSTLENRTLAELDRGQFVVSLMDWQPGGDVIAFWGANAGVEVVRVDGSSPAVPISGAPFMAWLDDGSIVGIGAIDQDEFGQAIPAIVHMDRATGEQTALDITIPDFAAADFVNLEPDVVAAGYTYADTYRDFDRAVRLPDGSRVYIQWPDWVKAPFDLVMCSHFEIRRQPAAGEMEMLYTTDDSTFISDLTLLPDGSLLFLRWALDGCNFTGNMIVSLMRMVPGEEPTVVTDQIDSGRNTTPNELRSIGYVHGQKYTVTPDGQYVFWIGGGLTQGESSLYVTDLESGGSTRLIQIDRSSLTDGIEGVYWVSLGE